MINFILFDLDHTITRDVSGSKINIMIHLFILITNCKEPNNHTTVCGCVHVRDQVYTVYIPLYISYTVYSRQDSWIPSSDEVLIQTVQLLHVSIVQNEIEH